MADINPNIKPLLNTTTQAEAEDTHTNIQLLLYRMDRQELERHEDHKEIMALLNRMDKGLSEVRAEVIKQELRIKNIEDELNDFSAHGKTIVDHERRLLAIEEHRRLLIGAVISLGVLFVGNIALQIITKTVA